jgi:hypothetical protein
LGESYAAGMLKVQAQSQAFVAGARGGAPVGLEQLGDDGLAQIGTGVAHGEHEASAVNARLHLDRLPAVAMQQRILE